MDDLHELVRACLASPGEADHRQALADRLEEQGQPALWLAALRLSGYWSTRPGPANTQEVRWQFSVDQLLESQGIPDIREFSSPIPGPRRSILVARSVRPLVVCTAAGCGRWQRLIEKQGQMICNDISHGPVMPEFIQVSVTHDTFAGEAVYYGSMGGAVPARFVREQLGLPEPRGDEDVRQ